MISLQQINNQYVRAIPIPDEDHRPIKGYDICEEVYANMQRKKVVKQALYLK